jgi:hypothetical protein
LCDRLFCCDCFFDCFPCFKTLIAFSLILSLHILFGCQFPKLFGSTIRRLTCKMAKWYHRHRRLKSSSTTRKAKYEALDFTASLRCWRPEVFGFLCVSLQSNYEPIIPSSTIIIDYLKPSMHIVRSPLSLQSFLFNWIKSYLLSVDSSSLASVNLRVRFHLRG